MTWEEEMIQRKLLSPILDIIERYNTPNDTTGSQSFKERFNVAKFNSIAYMFNTPLKKEPSFWYKVEMMKRSI